MLKNKKQFLVIGLGNFGASLSKTLYERGADVMAVDKNYDIINAFEPFCSQAVCLDATEEQQLNKIGPAGFDEAFVCITDIKASIFICLSLLQAGVKRVTSKAADEKHKLVLQKLGVHRVIIPEQEIGHKLALNVIRPNMIEVLSLSENFTLVEIKTPEKWQGKTVIELDLRRNERVYVLAVKRGEDIMTEGLRDIRLETDDLLLVYGTKRQTDRLADKATKNVVDENS
ncbi:MAG: TrkA family potassium uptake protein [Firmicutes bacterium]|nr:TrkA family potassium uptake protein [Bacillota bacterium]